MAQILNFRRKPETEVRKKKTSGQSAEIVIFPGVRYERKKPSGRIQLGGNRPASERF